MQKPSNKPCKNLHVKLPKKRHKNHLTLLPKTHSPHPPSLHLSTFMKKALALISGGLDSLLAVKIVQQQGIQVEGINFFTGFTGDTPEALKSSIPTKLISQACSHSVATQLGIPLHVVDVVAEFKPIMQHPKYGYGANLNPCLDCKLFMIKCAKRMLPQLGCDFLISGEVLGQRPMSQRKDTLPLGAKSSDGLLLRPLSARLLAVTEVERQGWVKRDALYAISGRGRKAQMELAAQFNLKNYPQPAGGCALTEQAYCSRFTALWNWNKNKRDQRKDKKQEDQGGGTHQEQNDSAQNSDNKGRNNHNSYNNQSNDYSLCEIMLARLGRHLRITPNLLLIVGRDEEDNAALAHYKDCYPTITTLDFPGALVLAIMGNEEGGGGDSNDDGNASGRDAKESIVLASRIAAYFSQARNQPRVKVRINFPSNSGNNNDNHSSNATNKTLEVEPINPKDMALNRYAEPRFSSYF